MFRRATEILIKREGNVLIVTLLILFAVTVIASTVAVISSTDLKIAGNQRRSVEALNVAEAGLNEAIHRISLPNPTTGTVGAWTGNVAISDAEPYDPNWTARIYLTTPPNAPAGGGSIKTTGTLQDPNQGYLEYSRPSGSSGVLTIQHKWIDRDKDGNRDADEIVRYDPAMIPPENFNSGFPVEMVTVTGSAGRGQRSIQAEVTKRTLLARTLGALYTDKAIAITGNAAFCGHNHDINTPTGLKPNACFAWHLASGHLPGVTTTGDAVNVAGSADLAGDPAPTDTSSTNPFYSLAAVMGISDGDLNQILSQPDQTSITNPFHGVTYVKGNADIKSNYVGSGLLYVTGDLKASGTWQFRGLIFVEGDLKITGTPWVLGSVIVKGTSDYNFSSGNAGVLYSKNAIQTYVGRAMPAMVLSWREL